MAVGADCLDRQDFGDRRAARRSPVNAPFETPIAKRGPEAAHTHAVVYIAVDRELCLTVANQRAGLPRSKRASSAEEEHGLEKARLSGTVRAKEVISRGVEVELDLLQAPKRADP
jgi:hypothetical protein